jgi:NAD(P)-dependent dehydrogenase (short-subunit alcohol dehydrogenase family)
MEGRVALVTGAGRGIGAAIAFALAREGCDVCLIDINEDESLRAAAEEIRSLGRRSVTVAADVRSAADARRAVQTTLDELGGLHVVVCNAGITRDGVVWKMTEEAWDDVLDVNLKGAFTMVHAAVPALRNEGWGRIVTLASINGLRGKFGQANYAASKAGLVGFTKSIARELGAFGVTANVVAPGMVMTEMAKTLPEKFLADALDDSVLGRLAEPEDVADAVAFLCSDRARSITGEVLRVDCGQYI